MKRIYYSSPFVPAEWIAAHGLEPVPFVPRGTDVAEPVPAREGVCPFMRMFVNEACAAEDAAGLVLTTTCDQMRRAIDLVGAGPPAFLMDVPVTWQTSGPHRWYRSELERLGRFLVTIGGSPPGPEQLASTLLDAGARDDEAPESGAASKPGIPVALLGGPLAMVDRELVRLVEDAGGRIVLDGTEGAERTRRAPLDREQTLEDPLGALAEAYFGRIPAVFRRPNGQLYEWLEHRIAEREVQGVVLLRYVWCDLWHAEVQRLREWLEVPLIDIDLDGKPATGRNRARIQAFLEGLRR